MANLSPDFASAVQRASLSAGGQSLAVTPALSLAEHLAREMADSWRRGERPLAETFLDRHPDLRKDTNAALRLLYEEICLRQEYEPTGGSQEVMRRFPQWQSQLCGLLECVDLLRLHTEAPAFPAVGDTLGEFRMVAELGHGALGRVFLAVQYSLADRLVVLKMTPRTGEEHLALARLQHTSIVPLYTAQDFPKQNLRVLCMPYLGGTALDQVLSALRSIAPPQRTGQLIREQLDRAQEAVGAVLPRQEKGRKRLEKISYEKAICHLGESLANALQYAHDRGMVHLDLKPSNVLLAADGEPMLLDFHLARRPVEPGAATPEWLGGTPGYMSPEQEAALDAVRAGHPVPARVDGRSDIYSLGVLLYEALAGELPPKGSTEPPLPLRNPNVSVGLDDIIHRCLCADPSRRYPDAASLAADLRCHLEDRPLRGVANRSLRERWGKWRRRRPYALVGLVGSLTLAAALLAAGGLLLHDALQRREDAHRAAEVGREQMTTQQFGLAARTFDTGLERLGNLPGSERLRQTLRHDLRQARRAERVGQLHQLAEALRYRAVLESWAPRDQLIHEAGYRHVWEQRELLTDQANARLVRDLEENVAPDLMDMVLIGSDLRIRLAEPGERSAARRQALRDLDEVERLVGPSLAVARVRQSHLERLGRTAEARQVAEGAARMVSLSAWEHCILGRTFLLAGDKAAAERELRQAAELQPFAFWPRFYGGVCAYRQGHSAEALRAFDRCVGAAPASSECHFYLGLACAALGQKDEALREYNIALASSSSAPGAAFLERGRLHAELGRSAEALKDLKQARDKGADPAVSSYLMARVQAAQNRLAEARASLQHALRHKPDYREARELLARMPGP